MESILDPAYARKNPFLLVLSGFLFVSLGVIATLFLKLGATSEFLLILFITLPSIPFILKGFELEEQDVEKKVCIGNTLECHLPAITYLAAFFLGMIIGFTFWYLFLPDSQVTQLFSLQQNELKSITASFQGAFTINVNHFETIFLHNLEVMALIWVFSLLYGAGAIFILTWNASVIAVFLGELAKLSLLREGSILTGLSYGFLGILPHGIFELASYLTVALSGGILSSAIIRKSYRTKEFTHVIFDVVKLGAWAIVILAIAAFIESTGG
ncbi:stage II sporulation protein M [Candidatus Micrarchaeota archaeon]|nr:stage II sporulation protein M [Candidatus Micrarchaeota archaeon]